MPSRASRPATRAATHHFPMRNRSAFLDGFGLEHAVSLPCCLSRDAQGRADSRPCEAAASELEDLVLDRAVDRFTLRHELEQVAEASVRPSKSVVRARWGRCGASGRRLGGRCRQQPLGSRLGNHGVERIACRPPCCVASPDGRGRTASFGSASRSPLHARHSSQDPCERRQRALSSVGARRVHAEVGGCDGLEQRTSCDVPAPVAWTLSGVLTVASWTATRASDVLPEGGSRLGCPRSTESQTCAPGFGGADVVIRIVTTPPSTPGSGSAHSAQASATMNCDAVS